VVLVMQSISDASGNHASDDNDASDDDDDDDDDDDRVLFPVLLSVVI